ncbi:MAG: DUF4168 domain-containing protein [Desulfobacteraceae bacterium]
MFKRNCLSTMIAAMCLVLFMALPAMAQQGYGQRGQPGQHGQPGMTGSQLKISDAELEKAAQAYVKVTDITNEFNQSLQKAKDASERQQLQAEANQKITQAVENSGINVEKYNTIMQQIGADEALRAKFMEKVQAAGGKVS